MKRSSDTQSFNAMTVTKFVTTAKEMLAARGDDDAAHYFEMVEEHLRDGKPLSGVPREVSKILGL